MKEKYIIIFIFLTTLLFSSGKKEQYKEEMIKVLIKTNRNTIKVGDEFKISFKILNNTNIKYGFTQKFFAINYGPNFYDYKNNLLNITAKNILDPIMKSFKEDMFLLKPKKKKEFSVKYQLKEKNLILHLGLLEYFKLPNNSNEFYVNIIFYNDKFDIKLGEEKLGYNMYKGKLESEKIKIIIED